MEGLQFDPANFANGSKPVPKPPVEALPNFDFSPANFQQHQTNVREAEAQELIELRNLPVGPIKAWSFSSWSNFDECPYKVYLSKIEKRPDPSGPAAERGSRIHTDIEDFIQGERDDLCKEASKHFKDMIVTLRDDYTNGTVEIEGDWGFDRNWEPADWTAPNVWARIKLDAIKHESETSAWIIDWKSGRKFGNELKHAKQLQLYVVAAFMKYPNLEYAKGEMIYLDQNDRLTSEYSREEAMAFIDTWNHRGYSMTSATDFPPKPSFNACRWCPHGKIQEGHDKPFCPHKYEN